MNSGAATAAAATSPTSTAATAAAAATATATATAMSNSGHGGADDWAEFCDRQAKLAAQDFARAFFNYVNAELNDMSKANLSYKDFLRKFFESFCDHFEVEYNIRSAVRSSSIQNMRQPISNNRLGNSTNQNNRTPIRASSNEEYSNHSQHNGEKISPKPSHKPFFRRLSFKGLKKGKGFFHKQQSDDTDQSNSENRKTDKHSKTKLSKIVVECRKEGCVNIMIVENTENTENNENTNNTDNTDVTQQFEKCRLSLVRASAGYMLEFFSSSKTKPRNGIFCSSITEVRETTALEMPDHENTFVLKTGEKEYIVEAKDSSDMKSWLATIRYCIRDPQGLSTTMENITNDCMFDDSSMNTDGDRARANSASKSIRSALDHVDEHGNPPELPPRLRTRSTSNLELCSSQQEIEQIMVGNEMELDRSSNFRDFPWFHGTLHRNDAATLVLHRGADGHGIFLVRQSETRKGEYVLTFNFQGKAKHLRMTLSDQGCRVQHLNFPTLLDMLEHFRQHPIPLETGGTADVKLSEYVVANPAMFVSSAPSNSNSTQLQSQSQMQPQQLQQEQSMLQQQQQDRRPAVLPEPREVRTFFGPIKLRTVSLERFELQLQQQQQQLQMQLQLQHQQQQQQQQQHDAEDEQQALTNRAVQNAYSFL